MGKEKNLKTGRRGEVEAAIFLRKEGFRIVARNFRVRAGEIDIIAVKGRSIVFVEVKARRSQDYGAPCEDVTMKKRLHIERAALCFLMFNPQYSRLFPSIIIAEVLLDGDSCSINLLEDCRDSPLF